MFNLIKFLYYMLIVSIGYISGLYIFYKNIYIDHGPDSNKIKILTYNNNGKCYRLTPQIIIN
jgi:hypothetical protein